MTTPGALRFQLSASRHGSGRRGRTCQRGGELLEGLESRLLLSQTAMWSAAMAGHAMLHGGEHAVTSPGTGAEHHGLAERELHRWQHGPRVGIHAETQTATVDEPGVLEISRGCKSSNALTVNFTAMTGMGYGTQGTDYVLEDSAGNVLTSSITIPAGERSVEIDVVPLASGATGQLSAGVALAAGDGYQLKERCGVSASVQLTIPPSSTVTAPPAPTIANGAATLTTPMGTPRLVSFDALVMLAGAALGTTDSGHVLQLEVSAIGDGTLQYKNGTADPVAASVGTVLSEGDYLLWSPPAGGSGAFNAFSVVALDGSTVSTQATQFTFEVFASS